MHYICIFHFSTECGTSDNAGGFVFLSQPPSTTIGECSPYQLGTNFIIILLQCNVRRLNPTDSFQIRWFRERNGQVEDLGPGSYHVQIQGPDDWLSRYHDTKLWVQPYSPSLLGRYWCQVIKTSVTPHQPLLRSNVFTLLPPSSYSQSTCSLAAMIQTVKNETCAILPDPSSTAQVLLFTTPVPSATSQIVSSKIQQHQLTIPPLELTSTTMGKWSVSFDCIMTEAKILISYRTHEITNLFLLTATPSLTATLSPGLKDPSSVATMFLVGGASAGAVLFIVIIIILVVIIAVTVLIKKRVESTKGIFMI